MAMLALLRFLHLVGLRVKLQKFHNCMVITWHWCLFPQHRSWSFSSFLDDKSNSYTSDMVMGFFFYFAKCYRNAAKILSTMSVHVLQVTRKVFSLCADWFMHQLCKCKVGLHESICSYIVFTLFGHGVLATV